MANTFKFKSLQSKSITGGTGAFSTLSATVNGLATTPTQGITLRNSTAAASGAQQVSPFLSLAGQGWNTTSSTSQEAEFAIHVLPVQGTSVTQTLVFRSRVGGGAFSNSAILYGPNSGNGAVFALSSAFGTTTFSRGSTIFTVDTAVETQGGLIRITSGGGSIVTLATDGSHTFAQRDGANAQEYRLYGTYTSLSPANFERLSLKYNSTASAFQIGTEKGSNGGTARPLEFVTDGVSRWQIGTTGRLTTVPAPNDGGFFYLTNTCLTYAQNAANYFSFVSGNPTLRDSGVFQWSGISDSSNFTGDWLRLSRPSSGALLLTAGGAEARFLLGGSTSSFPALKRSSTTLQVRLADDSAFAPLEASSFANYNAFTDTNNFERGKFAWESNVLRIGTEKLGTGAARALEFQTDGTTRMTIAASSNTITLPDFATINTTTAFNVLNLGVSNDVVRAARVLFFGTDITLTSNAYLAWSDSPSFTTAPSSPTSLRREATGILAQRTGNQTTGQPQTYRLYGDWSSSGTNFERLAISAQASGNFFLDTQKGGTGQARALEFRTDGTTRMTIGSAGTLTVNGSISATGFVSASAANISGDVIANRIQATVKNFYIDHPTKPDKHLVYSSLETPYNGVQLTGEAELVHGECIVQLPDYLHGLIHANNVHIQLTNYKHSKVLYVDSIDIKNNKFVVKCDSWTSKFKTLKFFWLLNGVRKDIELLQTEV